MGRIGTDEKRKYFQDFTCEVLTCNKSNQSLVVDFSAPEEGKQLENYLKNKAWSEDTEGETRVYLVKDFDNKIVLFFSIKCGLLYEGYKYDELDTEQQEFVNLLIAAKQNGDNETLTSYYESGVYEFDEMDRLFKIADSRIEIKNEGKELEDDKHTLKVSKCFSAIELQHFCKNCSYESTNTTGIPIGFGVFWEIIIPKLCEITQLIGCKYLYLFAADNTKSKESRKLVQYYKNDLKFYDVEEKMIIKPEYDNFCYSLVQEISELKRNREAVWEEFSDV